MNESNMTEKSYQLSSGWRQCAGVCSLMLPAESVLNLNISEYSGGWGDVQKCWLICNKCFKMLSRAHNMDNRVPPVEIEASIILFIVNTGEAWNHWQRSSTALSTRAKICSGKFYFPSAFHPKHVSAHQLIVIKESCWLCYLKDVCLLVIRSEFWLVTFNDFSITWKPPTKEGFWVRNVKCLFH